MLIVINISIENDKRTRMCVLYHLQIVVKMKMTHVFAFVEILE